VRQNGPSQIRFLHAPAKKPESVDLIYLDPPFNSNADYNVLFAEHSGDRAAARGRTEFRVNVPALPRKRGPEIGAA